MGLLPRGSEPQIYSRHLAASTSCALILVIIIHYHSVAVEPIIDKVT